MCFELTGKINDGEETTYSVNEFALTYIVKNDSDKWEYHLNDGTIIVCEDKQY